MAIRPIFEDENGNEMHCYLNTKGKVFLEVKVSEQPEFINAFITLDKQDVTEFIKILNAFLNDME